MISRLFIEFNLQLPGRWNLGRDIKVCTQRRWLERGKLILFEVCGRDDEAPFCRDYILKNGSSCLVSGFRSWNSYHIKDTLQRAMKFVYEIPLISRPRRPAHSSMSFCFHSTDFLSELSGTFFRSAGANRRGKSPIFHKLLSKKSRSAGSTGPTKKRYARNCFPYLFGFSSLKRVEN